MKTYLTFTNQLSGLRNVLATVQATEKISASQVHTLKQEVRTLEQYAGALESLLGRLDQYYQTVSHPLLAAAGHGRNALLILTGQRGLVGGLWQSLVSKAVAMNNRYHTVLAYGARGGQFLRQEHITLQSIIPASKSLPSMRDIVLFQQRLFKAFERGEYESIDVLYPKFTSIASQTPAVAPLLPLKASFSQFASDVSGTPLGLPLFEGSPAAVFDQALHQYLSVVLSRFILETKLSELSARTVAMEHANTQAQQQIQSLTLEFHTQRRRILTQRQLESMMAHRVGR